jgi:glycosyltransferase involved in cell wall biosynthesis
VTIHDTIHLTIPRTRLHPLYARFMMGSACRRARKVIAVSETTARDLESRLGAPRKKIEVIWNGVAPRFRRLPPRDTESALDRLGVRRPYVLFVGNYLPHKNVETLIHAWGKLAEPKPGLVLCGAGFAAARPIQQALAEVGGQDRAQLIERLALDDLVALYNGAELLASTSLYEGFCLPVVEAFACGTPVLASDTGAVPEIAGDAALLVPPGRVDLIASELYRLLVDQELRRGVVERGFRRAQRFSWEEAARRTLAVYGEVLAG